MIMGIHMTGVAIVPLRLKKKKNLVPLVSKLHLHFQENPPLSTERTARSHTKTTKKKNSHS